MAQQRNQSSMFDTFSGGKKFAIIFTVIMAIASVFLFNIPTGLAVFAIIFIVPTLWKDTSEQDPINGMMTYGSRAWKVAEYVTILKGTHRKHLFSPIIMLGFGPPEADVHKDLQPHMFSPPARLSAYWGLGFGICLSALDYLVHPYLYPLWDSQWTLPVWASMAISALFFFMVMQVLNATSRYHMALLLTGVDHTPAVMFNKIPAGGSRRRAAIQGAVTAAIAGAIATVISLALIIAVPPIAERRIYLFTGVGILVLAMFVWGMFRNLTKVYREEFMHQVERRDAWNENWTFKNKLIPFFEMEVPVPGIPGKPGGPPEGSPTPEPHVWVATFSYPMNGSFRDYAGDTEKIRPGIANADMMCITPIPRKNAQGESVPGTVSAEGFRVWWTDEFFSLSETLVNRDVTAEHKEVALRATVVEPLANIKGIGRCVMHSHEMMCDETSPVQIMRVTLVPMEGATESEFNSKMTKIKAALGIPWAGVRSRVDDNGRGVIDLFLGDGMPNNPEIIYPRGIAGTQNQKILNDVNWAYTFAMNKVTSPSGEVPHVMLSKNVMGTSNQIVFDIPAGISMSSITKAVDGLKVTSGNNFLELRSGIADEKMLSRKEKREMDKYIRKNKGSVAQFTAIASPTHPLEKIFLFSDYKDQLITGRESGVTKIAWSPGVKANGTLAVHDFNKDMPHLVLAGSSGSGKSVLIYSMICQLIANNGPEDLQIWIIDPKIGYQAFEGKDSITRYVDSWTPTEDFFGNCRDLFKEAVEEMKRRNGIFRFAQRDGYAPADSESIDKLAVARRIGFEQGPLPDGSPNPLIQPYIFIIIDEAAMLFAGATDPETKELQKEILYYAVKLARESRSAGIHMLISTQYPTKESIPTIIKQQSGRLGLKTQDQIASKVIIDEPGLEDLTLKGEGMLVEGSEKRTFRGFLLEEDGLGEHSMTEIIKNTPDAVGGNTKVAGAPDISVDNFQEMPEVDDSLFNKWDHSSGATGIKSVVGQGRDTKDPFEELNSYLDAMSEEEFANMDYEDFKKLLSTKAPSWK